MSKLHLINEIETAIKMANGNQYDQIKLMQYLDDLLTNYTIEAKDEWDFVDQTEKYITMYLNSLKVENYSHLTLAGYNYELRRFSKAVEIPLLKVKTADVRMYLSSQEHLKMSTIVSKLDIISSFYRWLVREEELIKNPCDKIKRPKLPKKVREGLTIIELEQVRNACKKTVKKNGVLKEVEDVRSRALIELFYSTGCRLDEIRKLNISDVDWNSGSAIVNGKGDKERRVYLSEKAAFYLEKYLETREDDCPALIASERHPIRRLTGEGIRYQVKKIKASAGIEKPFHPHILRHTFAQLSLNAGMELADLQALMGHEKADTTARYAEVSEERKQAAFKRFHLQ